jgi:hypothetical protein
MLLLHEGVGVTQHLKQLRPRLCAGLAAVCLFALAAPVPAQELDPRAYTHVPIDATFLVWGVSVSHGGVVTDATAPIKDLDATIGTPSLGVARSFNLLGKTGQAFVALPYSWAKATGIALGEEREVHRSGLSDMRLRMSVLLRGAPALSLAEFAKAPRRTIVGTSLTVVAPAGQFYPQYLINLGSNRWSFKPELAVSTPIGEKWLLDAYGGVWLFTTNERYYPGTAVRDQEPMATVQGHVSYNFRRALWVAFDATFYVGGQTTISGFPKEDRQANTRVGGTFAFPVGRRHSVKLAVASGAIVRYGANFTTFSFGWQSAWLPRPKPQTAPTR